MCFAKYVSLRGPQVTVTELLLHQEIQTLTTLILILSLYCQEVLNKKYTIQWIQGAEKLHAQISWGDRGGQNKDVLSRSCMCEMRPCCGATERQIGSDWGRKLNKTTEVLSSVARSALRYFFALYQTAQFFKRKLLNIKCVFWFSLQLLSKHFSLKNWARCDQNCILVFM